jgi:hypothetical protein
MTRTLTFVVCSLLTVVGHAIAQPAPGPQNLDHFNCYFAPGPVQQVVLSLQDQFDIGVTETVRDLRTYQLCNPVEKTLPGGQVTPIQHALDHLIMYVINPQRNTPRVVLVRNQFGDQYLRVGNSVILAVPSGKSVQTSPTALPTRPPIPTDLDHFKCYVATGASLDKLVSLKDQFQTEVVKILHPYLFCNPVRKTVGLPGASALGTTTTTPINNPTAHLTCYTTTPKPFQATVFYNNQFVLPTGPVPSLAVSQSEILCVPSFKLRWSVITPPTSLTANSSIDPGN